MAIHRHIQEIIAWLALAALLVVGLPLFVCMPLWLDVTAYDLAARNVLRGGVHYRDIWDNNLPGIVWLHMLIRWILGYSSEAIRLVDVAIMAGNVWLLVSWLKPLGLTRAARVGTAFILWACYLSTSEICHCQRDVWMLLPALIALHLRRRQLTAAHMAWGLAEGLCWGAAFWIKPFVAVPAVACWVISAVLAWQAPGWAARRVALDAASVLLGGLAAGAFGIAWLVWSGSWQPFWDFFLSWNREYYAHAVPLSYRVSRLFGRLLSAFQLANVAVPTRFGIWEWVHVLGVPVALLTLVQELRRGARRSPGAESSLLFAGFYLAWLGQATMLQHMHAYVQVPALLLALTMLAGRVGTLRGTSIRFGAAVAIGAFLLKATLEHPLLHRDRLVLWSRCWSEVSSADLRNRLALVRSAHSPDWVKLEQVADYLRGLGINDRELTCYHNSTHPLYLTLDLEPSTPFLHFSTWLLFYPSHSEDIRGYLARSRQRYVVSDLHAVMPDAAGAAATIPGQPLDLPPEFPKEYRETFPWNEPIVFRSGRYVIHRVSGPVAPLVPSQGASP
jgi:hypothetical protein